MKGDSNAGLNNVMDNLKLKKSKGYATYNLAEVKKFSDSEINKPLYRTILDSNTDNMNGLAFISSGYQVTYDEFFWNVDRIADIMTHNGIKPGDSVVEFVLDKFTAITIILACSKIGVQAIVAHPSLDNETLLKMTENCGVKLVFCSEVCYPFFASMDSVNNIPGIVVLPMGRDYITDWKNTSRSVTTEVITWNKFLNTDITTGAEEVKNGEYPLMVCGSTGTTGVPKLIVHTNKGINASVLAKKAADPEWRKGDVLLAYPPPFVVSGLACLSFAPLAMGVTLVSENSRGKSGSGSAGGTDEEFAYELILKFKPNILMTTKSDLLSMISQCSNSKYDLSHLRHVFVLGETINPKESRIITDYLAANRCKVILENFYGMSELTAFSYHRFDDCSDVENCSILPYVMVSAFDTETGDECPYSKVGQIYIKTPAMMKEYMFNSEATDNFFREDNEGGIWCYTGDIGYINEDNKVVALGRYTESFTDENGNVVFPYMIADVLIQDDNVISCKIITRVCDGKKKLAVHVLVKKVPEETEGYVCQLHEMLKKSDKVKVYPDMYKLRTKYPVRNSKISMRDLAAEQDGFIEVSKE